MYRYRYLLTAVVMLILAFIVMTAIVSGSLIGPAVAHQGQNMMGSSQMENSIELRPSYGLRELPPPKVPDCFDASFGIPFGVGNSFPPCDIDGRPYYGEGIRP